MHLLSTAITTNMVHAVQIVLLIAGVVLGMVAGRIVGNICGKSSGTATYSFIVSAFVGVASTMVGWHYIGGIGILGWLLAVPAYWLAERIAGFIEEAPELYEPAPSWKGAERQRAEGLSFVRGVGVVAGLLGGTILAAYGLAQFGLLGAFFICTLGAALVAVPAFGCLIACISVVLLLIVGVQRLFKAIDRFTDECKDRLRANPKI